MKIKYRVLLTFFFSLNALLTPTTFAQTEEFELKSELSKLQETSNFKILIPKDYRNWNLIIKSLSLNKANGHSEILITFKDKGSEKYMFECIQQSAAHSAGGKGEDVILNEYKGKFTTWADSLNNPKPKGGILEWVQEGTRVEMKSEYLTKAEMIQIAKKMN